MGILTVPYLGLYSAALWWHRGAAMKMIDETDYIDIKLLHRAGYSTQGLVDYCENNLKVGERLLSSTEQGLGSGLSAENVSQLHPKVCQ